jgi:hypothetical protein
LVSPFDDYADRSDDFSNYCLYDYCGLVYKKKGWQGIPFKPEHPQHLTYHQIVRANMVAIPTLLGKLLFLNKDSDEDLTREDYYCILVSLFCPWSRHQPIKSDEMTWETFFLLNSPSLIPRLRWYITNINLLHKTKEEDWLNRLQLRAQQAEPDDDDDDNNSHVSDDGIANRMQIDFDDSNFDDIPHSSAIDYAIETLMDLDSDFYVHEGIDASETQGYPNPSIILNTQDRCHQIYYSSLPEQDVMDSHKSLSTAASALQADSVSIDSQLNESKISCQTSISQMVWNMTKLSTISSSSSPLMSNQPAPFAFSHTTP